MSNNTVAAALLDRFPWLNRIVGWASLVALLLGTISQVLGNIHDIRDKLFELFGIHNLQVLHYTMGVIVVVLFLAGYLCLWLWLYKRYVSKWNRGHRWGSALAVLGALVMASFSIYAALPPPPNIRPVMKDVSATWKSELLALRTKDGGLRTSRADAAADRQVWSTAQSVAAMLAYPQSITPAEGKSIRDLLDFFEDKTVRLANGEGWGYMEWVDWGVTEIAAWVALAYAYSLQPEVSPSIWGPEREVGLARLSSAIDLLLSRQIQNGSWAPIAQNDNPTYARTYSTVVSLWALLEARRVLGPGPADRDLAIQNSMRWLLTTYHTEVQSWVPNPYRAQQSEAFPGLTAQVLFVLERARPDFAFILNGDGTYERARRDFVTLGKGKSAGHDPRSRPVSSNDRTHDSDRYLRRSKFMVEGSTFLWFPWSLAYCSQTRRSPAMAKGDLEDMERHCATLEGRINELVQFAKRDPFAYVMAESLMSVNLFLANPGPDPK